MVIGRSCTAEREGLGRPGQAPSYELQPGGKKVSLNPLHFFTSFCSHLDRLSHNLEALLPFSGFFVHQMNCKVRWDPRQSVVDKLTDQMSLHNITAFQTFKGFTFDIRDHESEEEDIIQSADERS